MRGLEMQEVPSVSGQRGGVCKWSQTWGSGLFRPAPAAVSIAAVVPSGTRDRVGRAER